MDTLRKELRAGLRERPLASDINAALERKVAYAASFPRGDFLFSRVLLSSGVIDFSGSVHCSGVALPSLLAYLIFCQLAC